MELGSWLDKTKKVINDNVKRLKNKDFMEAMVACCALVSAADGSVSDAEKRKFEMYFSRSEELKVFDQKLVSERFEHYIQGFIFDGMIGKSEALKAVSKYKGKIEVGRIIVSVGCAIAMVDGQTNDKEKYILREVCKTLAVDTTEFGL